MIQKFGDINSKPTKCCAIMGEHIEEGKPYPVTDYCGEPTRYKVVLDEESNKTRDYDMWCPEHRKLFGGNHWEA